MRSLLLVDDALLRDQVLVGLESCPGMESKSIKGWRELRPQALQRELSDPGLEWIWLELGEGDGESLLQSVREKNDDALFLILGKEKDWKRFLPSKEQWKIAGFLDLPLDVTEFFKTIGRLRSRFLATEKTD